MKPEPEVGPREISGLLLFHPKSAHLDDVISMEQRLTCANHADEETILDEIGWNNFNCPKCGHDYSIGRRIAVRESQPLRPVSHHDLALTHVKH
jgi:hypothetical protein